MSRITITATPGERPTDSVVVAVASVLLLVLGGLVGTLVLRLCYLRPLRSQALPW